MSTTVETSGVIRRPIEQVFDFLADFGNQHRWSTAKSSHERVTPGPIGPGTTWRMTARVFGRRMKGTRTVTQFRRPELVESRSDIFVPTIARIQLAPRGSATNVTFTLIADFRGLMNILAPVLVVPQFRRAVRRDFDNLKQLLESGA